MQETYKLQIAAAQRKRAMVRKARKKHGRGKQTSGSRSDTDEDEGIGSDDEGNTDLEETKIAAIKPILQTERKLLQVGTCMAILKLSRTMHAELFFDDVLCCTCMLCLVDMLSPGILTHHMS